MWLIYNEFELLWHNSTKFDFPRVSSNLQNLSSKIENHLLGNWDSLSMDVSMCTCTHVGVGGERSISIKGYSYDPDCMYVNGTGRDYYEFYIQLNRCGTLGENTHHQDSRKNPTVRNADMCVYCPALQNHLGPFIKRECFYLWKRVEARVGSYSSRAILHRTNSNCYEMRVKTIINRSLFHFVFVSRFENNF